MFEFFRKLRRSFVSVSTESLDEGEEMSACAYAADPLTDHKIHFFIKIESSERAFIIERKMYLDEEMGTLFDYLIDQFKCKETHLYLYYEQKRVYRYDTPRGIKLDDNGKLTMYMHVFEGDKFKSFYELNH